MIAINDQPSRSRVETTARETPAPNAARESQELVYRYLDLYTTGVIKPTLDSLRKLEIKMLTELADEADQPTRFCELDSTTEGICYIEHAYQLVNHDRRRIERLALDGPGDWVYEKPLYEPYAGGPVTAPVVAAVGEIIDSYLKAFADAVVSPLGVDLHRLRSQLVASLKLDMAGDWAYRDLVDFARGLRLIRQTHHAVEAIRSGIEASWLRRAAQIVSP